MSILPTKPVYRNQNPPQFFLAMRESEQDRLDALYLHGVNLDPHADGPRMSVDAFNTAAKAWLDDQTAKRAMSADPEHFNADIFSRPFPRREIPDWSDERGYYTWLADPDPNIHAPVLPAFAPTANVAPGLGFVHTADPKDALMFSMLSQILQGVNALRSK
jgi:hypothetical protein